MLEEKLTILEEPYIHLIISSKSKFYDIAWEWFFKEDKTILSRIIRGEKCKTPQSLFDEFSSAFQFPDYFGENWNALSDCLNDLEWITAKAYIVFISNVDSLLSENSDSFKTFIKILNTVKNNWVKGRDYDSFPTPPTPFHIVFHCDMEKEEEVIQRFLLAGIHEIDKTEV